MRQSFFDQKSREDRAPKKRRRPVAFCLEALQPRILFSGSPKNTGASEELLAFASDSQIANPQVTPNQPPIVAVPAAASPQTVTGNSTILSVLGADDGGESNLTYTWTTQGPVPAPVTFSANGTNAAKDVTATFSKAGNYVFLVTITDSGGLTTTSTVPVQVKQAATSIVVTPPSAIVEVNANEQFTATEYDQFGQSMPPPPGNQVTWTLESGSGNLNNNGNYTAPWTVGSATVEVISGSLSASASVSIQDTAPVITQITASPLNGAGTTTNLQVNANGQGGPANLVYSWVVLSKPTGAQTPGFSANGANNANNTTATLYQAGNYEFQVTVTDASGLSTTGAVSLQVAQTLASIAINPPASMTTSTSQQLTAIGLDQFGNAMAAQPTFTWTASGGGTVSSNGLFTASSTQGNPNVHVSSGVLNAQTNISVTASPTITASPAVVTGTTTALNAVGLGGIGYTYAWSVTNKPAGATTPTFSTNNSTSTSTTVTFYQAGNYTFEAESTFLLLFHASATINITVDQTLTSMTISPATASIALNANEQLTASGFDQFGKSMPIAPGVQWSVISGGGSIGGGGNYSSPKAATTATILASSGLISATATVTVVNAAPTIQNPVTSSPAPPSTTNDINLSVMANDDGGPANLTYTWSVIGNPPGTASFSANGINQAQNTTVTVSNPGTYDFQVIATDAGGKSVTSSASIYIPPASTQTPVITIPSSQQTNENSSLQFSSPGNAISITNSANTTEQITLAASNALMTLASASGLTFLSGTTGTNAATISIQGAPAAINAALNGLTFTPITGYSGPAGISILATVVGGNTSEANIPITINPVNLPPTVATPAQATPNPVMGTSTNLSVLGADQNGESSLTYSWSVLSSTSGTYPSFSLNSSNAAQNTVATFSEAGTYVLQATITNAGGLSATSSVTVVVDQTLTSISVAPANAAIGTNLTQQFTATGLDQFGQSMLAQPTFSWSATGGGSINSSGLYTAPGSAATATVFASSGLITGSTGVTVVGNGTAIASPSIVSGVTTNLSVLNGSTSGVTYTWSILTKPVGATNPTYSVNASSAAQSTTAMFFDAGNYTFQVAINNGTVTTQTVDVTVVQTLESIVVTPGTSSLNENGQQQFSAVGYDQFGNAMSSQPTFAWGVFSGAGVIDGAGLYTAGGSGESGSTTITATSNSISGGATITVTNAAPTVATIAAATPSPVTGTSTLLSVLGADDGGESNLTYSWSVVGTPPAPVNFSINNSNAAKSSTAQFATAGTYQFLVTISDVEGLTATSAVTVVVDQTLGSLIIAPPSATLNQHAHEQFSATAIDQFGNPMATPALTWSVASGVGSIDNSGLYSSPGHLGVATISVASGLISQTASITIDNAPPTVAIAATAVPSTVTGTTTDLSVLGADDGGEANLIYVWSTTSTAPAPVIFSANSTNASKNVAATFSAPGTYHFLVTIVDAEGASVTSTVNVQVVSTFASIAVTPANSSVERAASDQFSASALDQFGVALVSQPTFSWSTLGNIGSIDSTGLYTAPDAGIGDATIIATSGNISGSTTVGLIDDLSANVPPTQSTVPNKSVVFADANAISITDGDPDTQTVPLSLTLSGADGVISLAEQSGLTLSAGTGTDDTSMTFVGNLSDINNALQGLTFTPNTGFSGNASMTVTIDEVGVGQTSPSQTIQINVEPAAVGSAPATGSTSSTGASSSNAGNSGTGGILNQPINSTDGESESQSSGGASGNVFSDAPIVGSSTGPTDDSSPAPASAAPTASSGQQSSGSNSTLSDNASAKAAPVSVAPVAASVAPALAAAIKPPEANPTVPDVKVNTVPDQVFTFLAPESPMLKNLDTVKSEMSSEKSLKVAAGSATVVSFGASAAYFVWLLRGGSLLSSLLSIFPAWKAMDPLPVLDSYENSRKRRKSRSAIDSESLESMVDKSNQSTQSAPAINDEKPD